MSSGRHKGVPESGTIKLSDLKAGWRAGTYIGANTFSSAANGNVTAPSDATWVKIEVYGAGGGGRGNLGTEYGGGGGGYSVYEMPVEGGVTTFGYRVGLGGAGGAYNTDGVNGNYSWANNIPGISSITAILSYGGTGGDDGVAGSGGSTESDLMQGGFCIKKRGDGGEYGEAGGVGTYYYGGDAGGPSGGTGGTTDGADGTAPGGGGAGKYVFSSPYSGGDGADGQVKFSWYNVGGTQRLRDFIAGGSICDYDATGNNTNIPTSGTMKLRDFYSSEELGFYQNNTPTGYGGKYSEVDYDSDVKGGYAQASANLAVSNTTGAMTHSYNWGKALDRAISHTSIDTELLSRYEIQFTKTIGSTPTGSSVNTWITMSFGPRWYLNAERGSLGSTTYTANGYLRFRRTLDNLEVVNVPVYMVATAEIYDDFDSK